MALDGDTGKLASIHSSQWAPDPEVTIGTAVEAMTTRLPAFCHRVKSILSRTNRTDPSARPTFTPPLWTNPEAVHWAMLALMLAGFCFCWWARRLQGA